MSTPPSEDEPELSEQAQVRRAKRDRLLAAGVEPYPVGVERTHSLAAVRAAHPELEADTETGDQVAVAGRVLFVRNTGKLCFATLAEGGVTLQVMLSRDQVGETALAAWKADVDLGDLVAVHGQVIASRRGELSVLADRWTMAGKSLRPLPNTHRPLSEEGRVRQRAVDLIVRPEARRVAEQRVHAVRALRRMLDDRGFLEVETPMLQPLHGGAAARPFSTHINAFDMTLYLRIAPELYLKRCVVGGLDRVYEINRNFRNEGADRTHNPEFAMLELYEAYSDYDGMATLTREMIQTAAQATTGSTLVTHADGTELDLGGDWPSLTLYGSTSQALGEELTPATSREELARHATRVGVEVHPLWTAGHLVEELFEHLVKDSLVRPTFVRDFPEQTSPLTRAHRTTPGLAEKWDLYIRGVETATAYSELVDPVVQRERFVAQARLAAAGDPEAMVLDEDFLTALEYGLPPMGGMGMGIDRLLTALTGLSVRDTVLFPLVRPLG